VRYTLLLPDTDPEEKTLARSVWGPVCPCPGGEGIDSETTSSPGDTPRAVTASQYSRGERLEEFRANAYTGSLPFPLALRTLPASHVMNGVYHANDDGRTGIAPCAPGRLGRLARLPLDTSCVIPIATVSGVDG
jgi:hypothetical protein